MDLSKLQLPGQKAWAAGIGGLLGWGIGAALAHWAHISLSPEEQTSLAIVLGAAVTYAVPPSKRDIVGHLNDEIAQAGVILGKLTAASDQTAPTTAAARQLAAKAS